MNCAAIQRRLLALSEPSQPPSGLQAHLQSCPRCQEVQRRLAIVERHIPLVPVPPSQTKAQFLQRFRSETTWRDRFAYRLRTVQRWQVIVGSMAASLLLFLLVWSLAPEPPSQARRSPRAPTRDVLLDRLVQHHLTLAVAEEPRQQVASLVDLAEDLRGQARPLLYYGEGKEGKEALKDVADWYGRAVRLSVARAGQLPLEQRQPVLLPVSQQLAQACAETEATARHVYHLSADHPLYTIAFAARNGKDQLDLLLRQEADVGVPPPPPSTLPPLVASIAAEQARRFQQQRKLLHALVDGCLRLAEQSDLVQRASSCAVTADRLAEAIDQAVADEDFDRAQELAQGLKNLLQRGVAFNLTTAGVTIPPGTMREPELLQIGDHVKRMTEQLQAHLQVAARREPRERLLWTQQAVADGRAAVFQALQGRGSY